MNYQRILDVILKEESLEIPAWACAEIGEDFSMAAWLPGARTVGLSFEYPSKREPDKLVDIYAAPPDSWDYSNDYEWQEGMPDERQFFVLEDDGPEPIERQKLLIHAISFRELVKAISSTCGIDSRENSHGAIIENLLWRLTTIPLPVYFTSAFEKDSVFKCLSRIKHEFPGGRFLLIVLGERWEDAQTNELIDKEYNGLVVSVRKVMYTTNTGFAWLGHNTFERLCDGQIVADSHNSVHIAEWNQMRIHIKQDGVLEYWSKLPNQAPSLMFREEWRQCDDFFNRVDYTHGGDGMKPSIRYLFSLCDGCSEMIKGWSTTKLNDARKVIVKHLKNLFPLTQGNPFKTTRRCNPPKTTPQFEITVEAAPTRAMPGMIEKRKTRRNDFYKKDKA